MVNSLQRLHAEADAGTGSDASLGRREKARQRNLNKEDLLFNDTDMPGKDDDDIMIMTMIIMLMTIMMMIL